MDKRQKIRWILCLWLFSMISWTSAQTLPNTVTEKQKGITLKIRGQFQSTQTSRSKQKKECLEIGEKKALEDATEKGFQYILYQALPPLLITPDEKSRFEALKKDLMPQLSASVASLNIESKTFLETFGAIILTANIQFNSTRLNALLEANDILDSESVRHPKPDRTYTCILKIKENEFKKEEIDPLKRLGLQTIYSLSKNNHQTPPTSPIEITVSGAIYDDNTLIWEDIQRRFSHNTLGAKLNILTQNIEVVELEITR